MKTNSLTAEREHLANLLEAVQRCEHFLHASSSKVKWPLDGHRLKQRQKDEALATRNTRHFDDLSVRVINSWVDGQ